MFQKGVMNMNRTTKHSEAGFTLLEIMVVAGIFVSAMVVLMGSLISIMRTSEVTDMRIAATSFNQNVLETIRNMNPERDALLTFNVNNPGPPLIPGLPAGTVNVWAIDALGVRFMLPVADPSVVPDPPNPVEVEVEILVDTGLGAGFEYKFRTSSLIQWN